MTPFSSVAILEKLALLRIAFCSAPVLSNAFLRRTSVMVTSLEVFTAAWRERRGVRAFSLPAGAIGIPLRWTSKVSPVVPPPVVSDALS